MVKHPKTQADRVAEILKLTTEVSEVGFPLENPAIVRLLTHFDEFARTGQSFSGNIKLPDHDVVLQVRLSAQKHIDSHVIIASTKRPKNAR